MKYLAPLLAVLLLAIPSTLIGQTVKKPPRTMNYYPDGGGIVCVNGNNRYTRPLYGSHTRFRLETSDRPVFATYDRERSVNITFYILDGAKWRPLDSTSFCEARYEGGRRDYTLGDETWGDASLHISTLATYNTEGAIWQFHLKGFASPPQLQAVVRPVAKNKMVRDGDYGLEPRSSFEGQGTPLQQISWTCDSSSFTTAVSAEKVISSTFSCPKVLWQRALSSLLISSKPSLCSKLFG